MRVSYCRMVLRVPRELPQRLTTIQKHIFDETQIEYSYAAIVRGVIELGLNQVEGAPCFTFIFDGCRTPRGRRPGGKVATAVVPFDLTQGDMDLELEHNEDRPPKPKKEVVARRRARRRRRRPFRPAALLAPRLPNYDEDEEEEQTQPYGGVFANKGVDMWSEFYRNRPAPDPEAAARLKDAKARGDAAYQTWHVDRLKVEGAQRAKKGQLPPDK